MKHLVPREAFEFLHNTPQALLVDCRSEMEFLFVGHPAGALHVAWNDGPDWDVNPHFVGQVKKVAGTNHAHRPIVLLCRGGNRSIEAGAALVQLYTGLIYQGPTLVTVAARALTHRG